MSNFALNSRSSTDRITHWKYDVHTRRDRHIWICHYLVTPFYSDSPVWNVASVLICCGCGWRTCWIGCGTSRQVAAPVARGVMQRAITVRSMVRVGVVGCFSFGFLFFSLFLFSGAHRAMVGTAHRGTTPATKENRGDTIKIFRRVTPL